MDKYRLKSFKAIEYVKLGLLHLDYPDNLEIEIFKDDNGTFSYIANYEQVLNEVMTKFIMPIKMSNFNKLLKLGLEKKGFVVNGINTLSKEDELMYDICVEIATNTKKLKRVKRRKYNGLY